MPKRWSSIHLNVNLVRGVSINNSKRRLARYEMSNRNVSAESFFAAH